MKYNYFSKMNADDCNAEARLLGLSDDCQLTQGSRHFTLNNWSKKYHTLQVIITYFM